MAAVQTPQIAHLLRVLQNTGVRSAAIEKESQRVIFTILLKDHTHTSSPCQGFLEVGDNAITLTLEPSKFEKESPQEFQAMAQCWNAELQHTELFAPVFCVLDGKLVLREKISNCTWVEDYLPFALLRMVRILQKRV